MLYLNQNLCFNMVTVVLLIPRLHKKAIYWAHTANHLPFLKFDWVWIPVQEFQMLYFPPQKVMQWSQHIPFAPKGLYDKVFRCPGHIQLQWLHVTQRSGRYALWTTYTEIYIYIHIAAPKLTARAYTKPLQSCSFSKTVTSFAIVVCLALALLL